MKKIKKILVILLLFTTFIFTAQEINIKKSEIIKESKKKTYLAFSESDGKGGLITIKSVRTGFGGMKLKGYKIDHFDSDLKLIKSSFLENEKKAYINSVFIKDDVLHLIQFKRENKNKDIIVNVLSSSLNDLNFTSKKLYTFNREQFKKYFAVFLGPLFFDNGLSQQDKDSFGMITFSKNKNYFVLSFDIKNKKQEVHLFLVYDKELNQIYQTTFKSDIKDKYFDFEDVDINDDDGTIYLLGKVFENKSKKTKKKGKTNYHYELYKLTKDNKEKLHIKEEDKFIGSLYLLHSNSKLTLVGFYSEKNDYRYKGVCRFNLSDNLKINNKLFQPFSNQFFEDKYRKGAKVKKGKKELKNLTYRGVFIDSNDNIIINAEEFYITSHYHTTSTGGYWRTVYHFNDIISIKLDAEGKLLWARNINKAQTIPSNASFSSLVVNDKNYIFINTSDKIKEMSNNRMRFKQTSPNKSNLYVLILDEKGDFTYKKLIDRKESKVFYNVKDGIINKEDNSIIFQGTKKKHQRILKLQVN